MRTGVRLRTARPLPMQYQSASALLTKYSEKKREPQEVQLPQNTSSRGGQTPQRKTQVKRACWLMISNSSYVCCGSFKRASVWEWTTWNTKGLISTSADSKLTTDWKSKSNNHSNTRILLPSTKPDPHFPKQTKSVALWLLISCSSVDWPASQGPRKGHRRWWRTWPGCTSCGDAGNAGPACLWSRRRSWRLVSPAKRREEWSTTGRRCKQTPGSWCFLTLNGLSEIAQPAKRGHSWDTGCFRVVCSGFLTCLLAKTSRTASLSSSSASILISSSRASLTRSLSLLSTTKMSPKHSPSGEESVHLLKNRSLTSPLALLTLCVLKVVSPEGTNLVLPTHIPHSEADVLVFHRLHVEPWQQVRWYNTWNKHNRHGRTFPFCSGHTDGWDCGDYFPQFQLVEDCCFSCSIKSHHQDPHLLLSYEAFQQIPKNVPHGSDEGLQFQRA